MYAVDLKCSLVAHRVSSSLLLECTNTYIEGVKITDKNMDVKWEQTVESIRRLAAQLRLNVGDVHRRLEEAWKNDIKAHSDMNHAKMKIKKVIILIAVFMA
jgi:hypothetical protein